MRNKNRDKIYMIWWHIKDRCYNPKCERYTLYGGRGIRMSEEWKDFEFFYNDVQEVEGYSDELLMKGLICLDKDSIDMNNELYCKEKCIFISKEMNNKFKPNQMKQFEATSPNNEVYVSFNQSEFAREHNLRQTSISDCLVGRLKTHRGWIFKFI